MPPPCAPPHLPRANCRRPQISTVSRSRVGSSRTCRQPPLQLTTGSFSVSPACSQRAPSPRTIRGFVPDVVSKKPRTRKISLTPPLNFQQKTRMLWAGGRGAGGYPRILKIFGEREIFPPGSISRSTIGGARRPPTPTVRPLRRRRLCPILPAAVPRPPLAGNVW